MKLFLLTFLSLLTSFTYAQKKKETPLNLISYNFRYDNAADGENAWSLRKDNVKALAKFYDVDIVCAQEVLLNQYNDFLAGSKFAAEGAGRDDGKTKGEFSPIFYNKERFKRKDGGVFWLSETPNIPSKGWDARFNRICTWLKLYDKVTKKEFLVFNTHYDHVGVQARIESAKLVKSKINEIAPSIAVVFTGDLNVTPETEAIATIKTFLQDSREVSKEPAYGPIGTVNGFRFNSPLNERIDYVFVNEKIKVHKYAVLSDSKDQKYYSDHLPVYVRLQL